MIFMASIYYFFFSFFLPVYHFVFIAVAINFKEKLLLLIRVDCRSRVFSLTFRGRPVFIRLEASFVPIVIGRDAMIVRTHLYRAFLVTARLYIKNIVLA